MAPPKKKKREKKASARRGLEQLAQQLEEDPRKNANHLPVLIASLEAADQQVRSASACQSAPAALPPRAALDVASQDPLVPLLRTGLRLGHHPAPEAALPGLL